MSDLVTETLMNNAAEINELRAKLRAAEARNAELEAQLAGAASVVVTLTTERDKATNIAADLLRRLEDTQARTGQLENFANDAMIPCSTCGSSGFSKAGSGYDSVCDDCSGGYVGYATGNMVIGLTAERDAAQLELQQIRTMLDDGTSGNDNSALALVKRLKERCDAAQRDAWIDRM